MIFRRKYELSWVIGTTLLISTSIFGVQTTDASNSNGSLLIQKSPQLPSSYLSKIVTGEKGPQCWYGYNDIKDVHGSEAYQSGTFVTSVSSRIAKAYGGYRVRFEYYNDSGVLVRSNYINPEDGSSNHSGDYDYHNYLETQNFNQHIYKATINIVDSHNLYVSSQTYIFGSGEGNVNHVPVINAADKTIKQNSYFDPKEAVIAFDQEDGDLTWKMQVNSSVNTAIPGQYTVIYSVVDSNGNRTTKSITVTVEGVDHKPEIRGTRDLIINQGASFNARDGISAYDQEDGDLTDQIIISGDYVDTNKPGQYNVNFSVTDSDGTTIKKSIIVTVQQNTKNQAPVLTVHDMNVKRGSKFDPQLIAAAADAQDGDLTAKIKYSGYVDTNKAQDYAVNYSVTDSDGNTTTKNIVVHVVENLGGAPQINGVNDTTVIQDSYFNPSAGVSAHDNEDGDLTGQIKIDSRVNVGKIGDYQVTYTVWDSDYNVTQIVRNIHVKSNTNSSPELHLSANSIVIAKGSAFDPKNYISVAKDAEDGDLKDKVKISGDTVNTNQPGVYNVNYSVVDSDGNKAAATLNVTVKDSVSENHKPVIRGAYNRTINLNSHFDPKENVTAVDQEDGDLTDKIRISGYVDTSKPDVYKLIYSVSDKDGNTTEITVYINVVMLHPENHKPEIRGAHDFTLEVGDNFNPLDGITATDQEDGDLTKKITVTNSVNRFKPGMYEITYVVIDSQGLVDIKTIRVTVVPKDLPPVINVPDTLTVKQFSKFNPRENVTAFDQEDGELTSQIKIFGSVDTEKPGIYELTYQVTDSHGHTTIKTTRVLVEAVDSAPAIFNAYDTTIIVGQSFNPRSGITASDQEDGDLTNKVAILITNENGIAVNAVDTSKAGFFKVMYSVTDSAGNTTRQTITITIIAEPKISSNGDYSVSARTNTPGFEGDGFIRGTFVGNIRYIKVEYPDQSTGPVVPVLDGNTWRYYVGNNNINNYVNGNLVVIAYDKDMNQVKRVNVKVKP